MATPTDERLAELDRLTRRVSERAQADARRNGSTRPRQAAGANTSATTAQPAAPPVPDDKAMLYGLVGDVARAAAQNSEVNPVAAGLGFLSFAGAMIGRDVFYAIGDCWHHPRLFTLHVGRSARAGKGEAIRLVKRIAQRVAADRPGLLGQIHTGGLATREGLAKLIHDGYTIGRETVAAIPDKRLWVLEEEFSNILRQQRREGNTLSAGLREAWDGGSLRPATKTGTVWASDPHIGIAAAITPMELVELISARDMANGFLNRFVLIWGERVRIVPHPEPTAETVVRDLAERTAAVIEFARGGYPETTDSRQMHMTSDARALWEKRYGDFRRPSESELLDAMLERRAPTAIRIAMLLALTDRALVIEEWHLRSALAWIDYAAASVRYVFTKLAGDSSALEARDMAEKIGDMLRMRPQGATISEIRTECFAKRQTPIPLENILKALVADPESGVTCTERARPDGAPGRTALVYSCAKT